MKPIESFFMSNPSHLFHGMQQDHLKRLLGCATERTYERGDYIFQAGSEATRFYLIYTGEVAIQVTGYTRGDATIQDVSTGELLGISWIMEPYEYRFDAIVTEACRVLEFDAEALRDRIEDDYHFGYEVIVRFTQAIAKRLEATRLQMREMAREADSA
ncbi:MAG: cyclic nucleotide-binding domain-containing protein [Verrucomicrobia bacterium]|nr:cyclic nucleotide-binding domain-containing protein [Verrucomicrobiota bacterium]